MLKSFTLRLTLDNIVDDVDYEQKVVENLRYCKKIIGKSFSVDFWNRNLSSPEVKDFVTRNDYILCEINTNITKKYNKCWFLITKGKDKSVSRFRYNGDELMGIVEYIKMVKHLQRNLNENSNNW